jgi:nucleotide sugar dehydrogenase
MKSMIKENKQMYNTRMKVAIVGYGFVGKATHNGLKNDVETLLIDPKLDSSTEELKYFDANYVFICVPTPMSNDGSIDISIIESVFIDLDKYCTNSIIVLKSTVTPDIVESIINARSNVVYNPEFLRERTADEDFINSELIIFGSSIDNCEKIASFYKDYTNCICKEYQFMPADKASLLKYTINSFLALKVLFFNEIYSIYQTLETNMEWQDFIKVLQIDTRIGNSHMQVPGPDGRYGFGGACFPKDTKALHSFSSKIGAESDLIRDAITINNKIRSKYQTLDEREEEQNVNFI